MSRLIYFWSQLRKKSILCFSFLTRLIFYLRLELVQNPQKFLNYKYTWQTSHDISNILRTKPQSGSGNCRLKFNPHSPLLLYINPLITIVMQYKMENKNVSNDTNSKPQFSFHYNVLLMVTTQQSFTNPLDWRWRYLDKLW